MPPRYRRCHCRIRSNSHFVRGTSCIFAAGVFGWSPNVCSCDCANKQKQSPPAKAIGCTFPSTVSHAFPRAAYVQTQNARVAEYSNVVPFLWSDQSPDRLQRLHNRETVVAPFGENPHRVPHGLIHHWVGAVFLPGARLEDVLSMVRDYSKYKDFYAPNVIESQVLRQTDTEDTFSLRMLNKAVVAKFALDTEFQNTFKRIDENKWYSLSYTTRVREVENYGLPEEQEAPANTGCGLIWRLYSISRFEQRDGGVYVELEAVALSRDVPGALRWLVDPIVRRTSGSSMQVPLHKTEEAVLETRLAASDSKRYNSPIQSALSNNLPALPIQNGLMH